MTRFYTGWRFANQQTDLYKDGNLAFHQHVRRICLCSRETKHWIGVENGWPE